MDNASLGTKNSRDKRDRRRDREGSPDSSSMGLTFDNKIDDLSLNFRSKNKKKEGNSSIRPSPKLSARSVIKSESVNF